MKGIRRLLQRISSHQVITPLRVSIAFAGRVPSARVPIGFHEGSRRKGCCSGSRMGIPPLQTTSTHETYMGDLLDAFGSYTSTPKRTRIFPLPPPGVGFIHLDGSDGGLGWTEEEEEEEEPTSSPRVVPFQIPSRMRWDPPEGFLSPSPSLEEEEGWGRKVPPLPVAPLSSSPHPSRSPTGRESDHRTARRMVSLQPGLPEGTGRSRGKRAAGGVSKDHRDLRSIELDGESRSVRVPLGREAQRGESGVRVVVLGSDRCTPVLDLPASVHRPFAWHSRTLRAGVAERARVLQGHERHTSRVRRRKERRMPFSSVHGLSPERHRGPSESSLTALARGEERAACRSLDLRDGEAYMELDVGHSMRRVNSAPTLKTLASIGERGWTSQEPSGAEMEVYVVHRPLREFGGPAFQALPQLVKHTLRDLGVCHYMTVFRMPDGEMRQFDFGPIGGDISLKGKLPVQKKNRESRGAQGEIREDVVDAASLPEDCVFVGRTRLSLDDIRMFNQVQNSVYLLNQNDCRHYCNNLVKYSTGLEKVTSVMLASTVSEKRKARRNIHERILDPFIFACHYMTDCTNWKTVSRVRDYTLTVACTALGVKIFPERLAGPLMKVLPAKQVLPAIGAAAGKPFRNATITAFATAAASCSEGLVNAPLIRETVTLGSKISDGLKVTANVAESIVSMGLSTSVTSLSLASTSAVTVASEAATSAAKYAGSASRGAVKVFGLGMRKSNSGVNLPRLSKSARAAIGRPLAVSVSRRQG